MSLNAPSQFPNQFSLSGLTTTSTAGSTGVLRSTQAVDFGFPAAVVKISADGGGNAYIQLNQTGIASTSDFRLSTGDGLVDWYDMGTGISGVGISSTSTSLTVRIGAWG